MEKFSKWDDPSNGLNPFMPLEITAKPLTPMYSWFRTFVSIFLLFTRYPCVFMAIMVSCILHAWKYVLLIPVLIRLAERFIDHMCGKLLLSVTSFNNLKEQYHREHKDFDFMKFQKNELTVTEVEGDVYVCNQTCLSDWLWLSMKYSPIFTKIVIVEKRNGEVKAGLRPLGILETVWHAVGIHFPETVTEESPNIYYNITELKEKHGFLWYTGRRPVVIHPEGTKTNGLGILNIEKDISQMIISAASLSQNLRVHAIRFDHQYKNFAAYNSTDQIGFRNLNACLSQFTSKMIIQYYFNMEGVLHDCQNDTDRGEFIKRTLQIRRKEQCMKNLSWRDHAEFLKVWQKMGGDTQAKPKKN